MASTPRSRGSARTGSSKSVGTRGRLGAGVVDIPPVPRGNPAKAILTDPQVPENQRFCGNSECGQPVGRARGDSPGRAEGYCKACGTAYFFVPKLSRGDLVGGQYEVRGAIAHGGLGWIYLAIDRNVHNRWVVLKGLVNSADADAMATAEAEALALAEVEHPNIVRIHNFVEHKDAAGTAMGYIVMEYVGGTSLKQIRKAAGGPLSPAQAVAYIVEIAPALGYLHEEGLAYCDFKPDNVMQSDEQLKLIDLGATVAMDDPDAVIYGTRGYQAPEISRTGPTVATDVYTVGRTLAVLVMDVPQTNGRFVEQLPGPDAVPVFAQHESLYRAIRRATDPEPAKRFPSMGELADQLTGVLHEIAAADRGHPQPRLSTHFSPQRAIYGVGRDVPLTVSSVIAALGVPRVDPNDPGAALLATTSGTPPGLLEQTLHHAVGESSQRTNSVEVLLRLVRASLELGVAEDARARLGQLESVIPGDWRLTWYRGQCALLDGDFDAAAADFDAVLDMLPGELDPKLAVAATAELRGAHADATRYYEMVWRTNHTFYSAAFGLARERARAGNRVGAIETLDQITPASTHYTAAGTAGIEILLDGRAAGELDDAALLDAGKRASSLTIESAAKRETLRLQVLSAALDWLHAGNTPTTPLLLGCDFDEHGIRVGMEQCYRALSRETTDVWARINLVEKANAVRPRTRL
ncbi:serine/threonine-protein kinase [Mycobacterium sp. ITM-2016-00318]|uniref:serine/threonine-protein kinase n=1 Tax=Mycobacterium sp. ITM-2016-00318 TaxID=2099693 RepID=UPI001E55FBB8|nr:serine/threonine-protein kinase [Mycobacterium sp. ITM-2016-00318]WNG95351.1 tetratricopeptide repeat protein [Mycobacterium sp. ITM-2016-00318]